MPRTKIKTVSQEVKIDDVQSNLIKWVNRGGAFYMKDGKRVSRGETFLAAPEDVPLAFRDVIKPVDPAAMVTEQPLQAVATSFRLKQRGKTAFYDVVDDSGKRINEKDLTEQEAKQILDKLR